jgi:hypothetical protein
MRVLSTRRHLNLARAPTQCSQNVAVASTHRWWLAQPMEGTVTKFPSARVMGQSEHSAAVQFSGSSQPVYLRMHTLSRHPRNP